MTLENLFSRILPALDSSHVPYMLTGSVASSLHGSPRSTRDLDIVIAPMREQLLALMQRLSALDYFADEHQAVDAFARRGQFNVIDNVNGWKVDFIFQEDCQYGRAAFERRQVAQIAGYAVQVSSAEDVLIAKMRWAKLGGSDRQLQDATGILSTQSQRLDVQYVERWVRELQLDEQWKTVRQQAE